LIRGKDEGVGEGPAHQYNYVYKPWLAERWEIAPDGKSITFHLRKGVKWAPVPPLNGREVTAEDVKFSYDRLAFDSRSTVRGAFPSLSGVEVLDKYTVKLTSAVPSAMLIESARNHPAWIIPKEVVEQKGNLFETMIGAGPFYLEKAVAGVGWTLARNPNFFDAPRPYPDQIRWLLVIDRAALTAAFRSGQLDVLTATQKEEREQILKTNPKSRQEKSTPKSNSGLVYKADEPGAPWTDIRVRIATSKAIDRAAMIDGLYGGEGYWGGGMMCGFTPQYCLTQEEKEKIYNLQYDPKVAKQLMKEAGYPNGFKADLAHLRSPREMLVVTQMLKETLNIQFNLLSKENADFVGNGYPGNYPNSIYFGLGGGNFQWFHYLQFEYHSKGKWPSAKMNTPVVQFPEVDPMIEDIFGTMDPVEQARKTREFQSHILNKILYWIPVVNGDTTTLIQPWLKDHNQVAIDSSDYVDFWISK